MREHGSHLVGSGQDTGRVEALTDGVFAIVMTLMVFDIRVPVDAGEGLGRALAALWPEVFAYAVSFVQLGIYWSGHRSQFAFIVAEDHRLRWISLLLLALTAFIPFSTQLLGRYLGEPLAFAVYAGNLIVVGLVLAWHWRYATTHPELVVEDLPSGAVSVGMRRCLTAPLLYALALALVFFWHALALAVVLLVPLLYLFPVSIDRLWGVPRP